MATGLLSKLQSFSDGICKVLDSLVEEDQGESVSASTPDAAQAPIRGPDEDLSHTSRALRPAVVPQLMGSNKHPPSALSKAQLQQLKNSLPPHCQVPGPWHLLYNTLEHGVILNVLYQKVQSRYAPFLPQSPSQRHSACSFRIA